MRESFVDRITRRDPVLIDGAMGTELTRRGLDLSAGTWSAAAMDSHPDLIREIHAAYVAAGAEVLTANTFRTHGRSLAGSRYAGEGARLTKIAVELARQAADGCAWVAGSLAPLEDCYRPDLVPPLVELEREHALQAEALAEADVDLILAETHNCILEASVALWAALAVGKPAVVSFVCGSNGRLLSGESLQQAAVCVLDSQPAAVLANCLPVTAAAGAVQTLSEVCGETPFGAYANTGVMDEQGWHEGDSGNPAEYAAAAGIWVQLGAKVIGGCCGTTPAHISALQQRLNRKNSAESQEF